MSRIGEWMSRCWTNWGLDLRVIDESGWMSCVISNGVGVSGVVKWRWCCIYKMALVLHRGQMASVLNLGQTALVMNRGQMALALNVSNGVGAESIEWPWCCIGVKWRWC